MNIRSIDVPSSFKLLLFGDTHYGSSQCSMSGVEKLMEELSGKNTFGIHMGDWIEAIAVDDPRFDDTCIIDKPLEQAKGIIDLFKPVAKKILCGLQGNHELKLRGMGDLSKLICDGLDVWYGDYVAKVSFSDAKGFLFKVYLNHGFGNLMSSAKTIEQRRSNMMASLKQQFVEKSADALIMAMGHNHQLLVVPPTQELYIVDDGTKTKQRYVDIAAGQTGIEGGYVDKDKRWYLATGSFYKTFGNNKSGYAERHGYNPVELGYMRVIVDNRKVVDIQRVVV